MRLRGSLPTSVIALLLAASWTAPASAGNFVESPVAGSAQPSQSTSQQSEPQTPSPDQQPLPPVGAISSYEGLPLAEVRFADVPNEQDRGRFLHESGLTSGSPLQKDQVRKSIQALYGTGRFADIQVEAEKRPDGRVTLVYHTVPNFFIGRVSATGAPSRPSEGQLVNSSKLQLGEIYSTDRLETALRNMQQLLQENGYYRHVITTETHKNTVTQQMDVVFHLTPGEQAHVGTLTVTGNTNYSGLQIRDMAKMHSGDPVSSQRLSNGLERLRKKYQKQNHWLAQVVVAERSYHPESNAVDYVFDITSGPRVEIETEGFKISRGVLKRNVPVYQENALDDDLLNEGRRNLLNYMQGRGYFEAKVDYRRQQAEGGNVLHVIYRIDPGPRHKLVKVLIAVKGADYFGEEILRSHMQVQPAGRVLSNGRYSQRLLSDDIHGLEDLYRANGFEGIKIASNVIDDYQGQENAIAVQLNIDEGTQTRVAELRIVGNQAYPEKQLRNLLNTSEGQPFSEYNISQDRDTVLNYYFNHGFPDATFDASAKPAAEPNRVEVTFTIHEGKQVFVNQVLLSGLEHTHRSVVRRELQIKAGDPLSQIDMLTTQQKLYDLGIFSQVDTAVQNPQGDEQSKNVLVNVDEAPRYTFNYGFGLEFQTGQPTVGSNQPQGATGVSPRFSFGVTRLNFRGRDHTLSFKGNVGRLQQRGLISYEAPRWFNSPDWKLTFTTFYDNTVDVTTFTSERLEGSVSARQTLSRAANMDYHFTYRRVLASNLVISSNQIPLLSQPVRVGIPGVTYIQDTRDNPLESTRGNYTTFDLGVASGYFGSETSFARLLVQNSTYYAFGKNRPQERKFVLARSTTIGVEVPYSSTVYVRPGQAFPADSPVKPIPLPELFLAGGGNSHRGFGLNQAGPRDPNTGFPIGGSALFLNNLELRMPPVNLPWVGNNISFAIFHDAGNVFVNSHDMLHNLLQWKQQDPQLCLQESTRAQCNYNYISHAIGLGVHYKTPIGPVRFDFGYNLNPPAFPSLQTSADPNNPGQTITTFVPQHARHFNVFFSIGQTF